MNWSTSSALREVRLSLNLNQRAFGERLTISPTHISLIESGKKKPSKMLLKLTSFVYGVDLNWIETGEGQPFKKPEMNESFLNYKNKKQMKRNVMIVAAIFVPLIPAAAAGLTIGVGIEETLERMKRIYGAKTLSELANKFLQTNSSALSRWKAKGKIPEKYLKKVHTEKNIPIEQLLLDEELIIKGRKKITNYIKEKILADRSNHININEIEVEFNNKFPLEFIKESD